MRKTRLIILPARCLAMIGFLLLYLACPILAEMSRAQPDSGLASSFQLKVLEHCASPPEDPGEGGCANSRNALPKMTRNVPPDIEHDNTCSITDAFLLENTCSMDQRPAENAHGHPRQAKRYARASPRRLLAARSTDPSAAVLKIQAPRRQIKYRSLKRREVPKEELAVTSQRQDITSTRTLLAVQRADRIASGRTDTTRRALSTERDVPRRTAEKPFSRRISELEASRKISAERQYPSRTAPDSRALAELDISRRQSKERHASRRTTMESEMFQIDGSRRFTFERQPFHKHSADRRASESDVSRRMSTERRSSLRTSTDRRIYEFEFNTARRSSVVRQSERRMSTERRTSEPAASRISEKRETSRRLLTDRRMLEYSPFRRISSEREYSRTLASDRISETRSGSMAFSERRFSGIRLSRSPSSGTGRDDSRKPPLGIRILSERTQVSRVSTERLDSERRSSSRRAQPEERRLNAEKPLSRRYFFDESRKSEGQTLKRSLSETRIDSERINAIRRTTRNINSHISSDRRNSRTLPSIGIAIRSSTTGRVSDERRNKRLSRLTSPFQPLSLSSEQKKNQRQSSESLSRISVDRRNVRISSERLTSRISSDLMETLGIPNERHSTVSSNKFPPYRNSINRVDLSRIADNRRNRATSNERISLPRISANRRTSEERHSLVLNHEMSPSRLSREHVPLEERRNMKLHRERRSLSSESFGRRSSFRRTEERRFSSDRSAPLNSMKIGRISEERRASRTSPTTDRLLTTSRKTIYANPLGGRIVQNAYRQLSEHAASGRTSNERVLAQRSNLSSRRIVTRSTSDERRSSDISISTNNRVTESATRRSLGRNSVEINSKATFDKRLNKVSDSRRISARRLVTERASRSTERSTVSAGISVTGTDSMRISAERLVLERNSRRSPELLPSVRYSRISSERNSRRSPEGLESVRFSRIISSERNYGRSPERLPSVRDYRKISTERLTSKRQFSRSTEHLASVGVLTRITPERMISARGSRRYAGRLALVRDIRTLSVDRMAFGENSRWTGERSVSVRNSRQISTRVAAPTDSKIFTMRMSLLSNSRETWAERTETQRKSRPSVERLASVRGSRKTSTERLSTQRPYRSADRTVTVLRTRASAERSVSERDSSRPVERLATNMNSRTSAQLVSQMDSRQSVDSSASLRNARLSADGLSSVRNSRRTSVERLSSKRMVYERRSVSRQYSPDRLAIRKLAASESTRALFSERRVSRPEMLSVTHVTSKAPERRDTNRMSNTRNIKLYYGRISNNQALYQGFGLSEKRLSTMNNTTLKTESLLSTGLPLGTIQKSVVNFKPAQYSSWSDKATECVRCALATLTIIWPALTIWKGSVLESLTSLDVGLAFSPKMDHLNSFFADKPTSNYALVPDDLAPFGSTKPSPPVMRERGGLLTTVIGGGVAAAVMLLSTKPK